MRLPHASPPGTHHFLVLPRLGGKRSSLKGWVGDNQGPIQLPGAQCSQHRPSISSESFCCVAHPKPPCELPISVKAGVPSLSLSLSRCFPSLSLTHSLTPPSRVVSSWCSPRPGRESLSPAAPKGTLPIPTFLALRFSAKGGRRSRGPRLCRAKVHQTPGDWAMAHSTTFMLSSRLCPSLSNGEQGVRYKRADPRYLRTNYSRASYRFYALICTTYTCSVCHVCCPCRWHAGRT
ncbi:hypothetical protein V8C34DRAFT_52059 [Trichoderma compactum]